jgi:hypothetical protein
VRFQQLAPADVAELDRPRSRVDDVREEDRAENPVTGGTRATSCQELLDLVNHDVNVSYGETVVLARNFDELGSRDPAGDFAACLGRDDRIPATVDDQGRRADGRQDLPDVDVEKHPRDGSGDGGTRGLTEETCVRVERVRVVDEARI